MANLPGMAYRCRNDANWSMEFVSEGCFGLTGYPTSAVQENRLVAYGDLIHPHDRKAVWDGVQQALAKRCRFQLEYRIRTAQGEEKWVWEQGAGVFSETGELQALEGFITDINDRKRTEARLQELNNRLDQLVTERTAELTAANQWLEAEVAQRRQAEQDMAIFERFVDAATQGFGMADADGRILYANPYMAQLFGTQRPEDVVGKHISNYYPADYLRRREGEILPALRRGEPWRGEQVLAFLDGQMHPTIQTIFPVQDDDGKFACTAVVITDITDLRRAEDALRKSYEELRASQERFELAVRGSGVGIWDWDIRTRKSVRLAPLEDAIRLRRERDWRWLRGLGQPSSSG